MVKEGYKQTEIGVIPEDWEVKSYEEVFKFLTTATYPRSELTLDGEIQYLHYGDIHTKYHSILDFKKHILPTIKDTQLKKYPLLQDGDLIMADASEDYKGICKSVEVKNIEDKRAISGLHTFLLRDKNNILTNGFRGYLSSNILIKKQFDKLATGMKVFGVSKSNLKTILIPIPPKEEQKAIANALSSIDKLIEVSEKIIAKKEAIKLGTMQKLLSGKKEDRLKGFSEEWENKRLENIGYTYSGLSNKTKKDFMQGNSKYITFLNIINNVVININTFETVNVKIEEKQNKVKINDLFFNTSSETPEDVGKCAILLNEVDDLYLNSFCFGFRLTDKDICGLFLSYLINSEIGRKLFSTLGQGATRYNLSKNNFNNVVIKCPPLQEQQAIAKILSDMDRDIEILKQKLVKTKAIKKGMMQDLLSGKVRFKL